MDGQFRIVRMVMVMRSLPDRLWREDKHTKYLHDIARQDRTLQNRVVLIVVVDNEHTDIE
jgi:hypothetical protein